MNLAPVLDLTDEKESYIYQRSYGNDPLEVSYIAAKFANVMRANRIVTTGKHFPNLSQTRPDSHKDLPILERSVEELLAHELVPFRRLVRHLGAVMVGHVIVPELDPKYPASISVRAMKLLRQQIGWQGVVISDDIKMKALSDRYPLWEIVMRSIYADVDILCVAWGKDKQQETVRVIEQAVQTGKISLARIDTSVRRILTLKYAYGR